MPDGSAGPGQRSAEDRAILADIRTASGLAALTERLGAPSEHAAYLQARRAWYDLKAGVREHDHSDGGLPGDRVRLDEYPVFVHGVTHADTEAERSYLRDHASDWLESGHGVYTEQGIRDMYFADMAGVCEMDDYLWARDRCQALELKRSVFGDQAFTGLTEEVDSLAARFRETVYGLLDTVDDDRAGVGRAVGDIASSFLMSHEDLATGDEFEAYVLNRRASRNPAELDALQRYYERTFLPQPLEREWLRRHDPELEIVTHARNERMADYIRYHWDGPEPVHVIAGAAHQPGVRYYLERHAAGERDLIGFEPIG